MFLNINLRKTVLLGTLFSFLGSGLALPPVYAQEIYLPQPGVRIGLSPEFNPPVLKGLKVHPDNPFRFDFILDKGDSDFVIPAKAGIQQQEQLKTEAQRLIKYFLASLTVPEKDLWVNLSPYEKDRIVPESFGETEMGRDLLAQDYLLKQITASLIYPEDEFGKTFWKRIYEEASKRYHTTNIPVNTFNKVWIVPEKAVVYENAKAGTAYVVESRLKVMLEQDYLALANNQRQPGDMSPQGDVSPSTLPSDPGLNTKAPQVNPVPPHPTLTPLGSQIVREIVIPQLTKEVNENKNFAQLRQVYNSLILATWYKKKIKDSILSQVYADKNKVKGVEWGHVPRPQAGYVSPLHAPNKGDTNPPAGGFMSPESIYQQYLTAFKKGVYNYIKEEQDPITQQIIPRKYFSGGVDETHLSDVVMTTVNVLPEAKLGDTSHLLSVSADLAMSTHPDDKSGDLGQDNKMSRRKWMTNNVQLSIGIGILVGTKAILRDRDTDQIRADWFLSIDGKKTTRMDKLNANIEQIQDPADRRTIIAVASIIDEALEKSRWPYEISRSLKNVVSQNDHLKSVFEIVNKMGDNFFIPDFSEQQNVVFKHFVAQMTRYAYGHWMNVVGIKSDAVKKDALAYLSQNTYLEYQTISRGGAVENDAIFINLLGMADIGFVVATGMHELMHLLAMVRSSNNKSYNQLVQLSGVSEGDDVVWLLSQAYGRTNGWLINQEAISSVPSFISRDNSSPLHTHEIIRDFRKHGLTWSQQVEYIQQNYSTALFSYESSGWSYLEGDVFYYYAVFYFGLASDFFARLYGTHHRDMNFAQMELAATVLKNVLQDYRLRVPRSDIEKIIVGRVKTINVREGISYEQLRLLEKTFTNDLVRDLFIEKSIESKDRAMTIDMIAQKQRALLELAYRIRQELPNIPIDWGNAAQVPWDEVVRDPRQPDPFHQQSPDFIERFGDQRNQIAFWSNQIDVRGEFLTLLGDMAKRRVDFQEFKGRFLHMHRTLLLGADENSIYVPPTMIPFEGPITESELQDVKRMAGLLLFPDLPDRDPRLIKIYGSLNKFVNDVKTGRSFTLQDIISSMAYVFQIMLSSHGIGYLFEYGNNSFVTDMMNGTLRLCQLEKGIAHGDDDYFQVDDHDFSDLLLSNVRSFNQGQDLSRPFVFDRTKADAQFKILQDQAMSADAGRAPVSKTRDSAQSKFFASFEGPVYYPASELDLESIVPLAKLFPKLTKLVYVDVLDPDEMNLATYFKPEEDDGPNASSTYRYYRSEDLPLLKRQMERKLAQFQYRKEAIIDQNKTSVEIVSAQSQRMELRLQIAFKKNIESAPWMNGRIVEIEFLVCDIFDYKRTFDAIYVNYPGYSGGLAWDERFWEAMHKQTSTRGYLVETDMHSTPDKMNGVKERYFVRSVETSVKEEYGSRKITIWRPLSGAKGGGVQLAEKYGQGDRAMQGKLSKKIIEESVFVRDGKRPPIRYFELGKYKIRGEAQSGYIYAREKIGTHERDGELYRLNLLYSPKSMEELDQYKEFKKQDDALTFHIRLYRKGGVWTLEWFYPYGTDPEEINRFAGSGGAEAVLAYLVNAIRFSGGQLQSLGVYYQKVGTSFQAARLYMKERGNGLVWPSQMRVRGPHGNGDWKDLRDPELGADFYDVDNVGSVQIRLSDNTNPVDVQLKALGDSQYKITSKDALEDKIVNVSFPDSYVSLDGRVIGRVTDVTNFMDFQGMDQAMASDAVRAPAPKPATDRAMAADPQARAVKAVGFMKRLTTISQENMSPHQFLDGIDALSQQLKNPQIAEKLVMNPLFWRSIKVFLLFLSRAEDGHVWDEYCIGSLKRTMIETVERRALGLIKVVLENPQLVSILTTSILKPSQNRDKGSKATLKFNDGESVDLLKDKFDEIVQILEDPRTAAEFIIFLSLLRKIYSSRLPHKGFLSHTALEYAIETGIYFPLGNGLYVTPVSESFRRHIIFRLTPDKRATDAIEIMIPGDHFRRKILTDHRLVISQDIYKVYGPENGTVKVLAAVEYPGITHINLYGKDYIYSSGKLGVLVFDYSEKHQGRRLADDIDIISITPEYLERINREVKGNRLVTGRAATAETIVKDALSTVQRFIHQGYYFGAEMGGDMHLGNFRLTKFGEVEFVSDYDAFFPTANIDPKRNIENFEYAGALQWQFEKLIEAISSTDSAKFNYKKIVQEVMRNLPLDRAMAGENEAGADIALEIGKEINIIRPELVERERSISTAAEIVLEAMNKVKSKYPTPESLKRTGLEEFAEFLGVKKVKYWPKILWNTPVMPIFYMDKNTWATILSYVDSGRVPHPKGSGIDGVGTYFFPEQITRTNAERGYQMGYFAFFHEYLEEQFFKQGVLIDKNHNTWSLGLHSHPGVLEGELILAEWLGQEELDQLIKMRKFDIQDAQRLAAATRANNDVVKKYVAFLQFIVTKAEEKSRGMNNAAMKIQGSGDRAMAGEEKGGIDLTADKTPLEVKMDSRFRGNDNAGIKFNIDPAMLEQLQNASGFVPVIINIQPMTDLRLFLGIKENRANQSSAVI